METQKIFAEMILLAVKKSEILGISYNTDGIIKQDWIEEFCKKNNYYLETKKINYKRFQSQSEIKNKKDLEELLWIIKK